MDSVTQQRETRRKQAVPVHVAIVVTMLIGFAIRGGIVGAAVLALILVSVFYVLPRWLVARALRAERERRQLGADPSWAAKMPVCNLLLLGGRTKVQKGSLGLTGRLSLTRDTWVFTPSKPTARNEATSPVSWPRTHSVQTERSWGLADTGVATFTTAAGIQFSIEVRHPDDLANVATQDVATRPLRKPR